VAVGLPAGSARPGTTQPVRSGSGPLSGRRSGPVGAAQLPSAVVGAAIALVFQPGIRVRDDGITLGQVAYTERHARLGFSEKMGVPHFGADLPFDHVVAVQFLRGAEIITARDAIRASAPPRMAKKLTKARKQVPGLFYTGGLSDATYIGIQPDQTVGPIWWASARGGRAH
jgi:hypothetical protein